MTLVSDRKLSRELNLDGIWDSMMISLMGKVNCKYYSLSALTEIYP